MPRLFLFSLFFQIRKKRGEEIDEETEDEFYMRRLDSGLFTLQLIDYIISEISVNGDPSVKNRVLELLNVRGETIDSIARIMKGLFFFKF